MRIILLVVMVTLVFSGFRYFKRLSQNQREVIRKKLIYAGLWGVAIVVAVLVLTGRLPLIFALLGGLLPLLQRAIIARSIFQMWKNWRQSSHQSYKPTPSTSTPSGEQQSKIQTLSLNMQLNHGSGQRP